MRKCILIFQVLTVFFFYSCASKRSFVYLQDMEMGEKYPIDVKHEAVIHRDDRLSITVSCKNPELAIPFNMNEGTFRVTSDGSIDRDVGGGTLRERGYRVDKSGTIDFPILGKLYLEGLTVTEAIDLIRNKIMEGDYIKDPLVSIEFLNFKYTVLGAVARNGTFTADGDRVTLLEAIAKAGDLSTNARINKVAVIREVGNNRQLFMHDLRRKDIFDSPCFYLQQNDIVYVEPKYKKKDTEDRGVQYTSLAVSITSAVSTLLLLLLR